ncbi:MAG: methyltransferase [Pseudodesulfovibrio sp.]
MAVKEYDLDQPMDKLLSLAANKFGEVEFQGVSVGGRTLELLQIRHMQRYIDKLMDQTRAGKTVTLPLWAKIWQSGLVLGSSVARFPLADKARVLEIGGGASVSGLILAGRGFDVTVADQDPDALLFARINALRNGLSLRCVRTDFEDDLAAAFDCVVAGEMLFDERVFDGLADFLDRHVARTPEAEVFLAMDLKRAARKFFTAANEHFAIMRSETPVKDRETGEEKTLSLFRFKRREA